MIETAIEVTEGRVPASDIEALIQLGRMMLRRRDMQSVADVVSLDLARRVDGRTVDQIESDPAWVAQQHLSAERNDFPITGTRVLNVQRPFDLMFQIGMNLAIWGNVFALFDHIYGYDKVVQIFDPRYYDDRDAALDRLFALSSLLVAPRALILR